MSQNTMLCLGLYAASRAMTRVYQPLLDPLGLTYPQFMVLVMLWEEDRQPVGALGRLLMLDTNTLTPLLKRIEAAGLVTRARNPQDERQVIVSLTEEGRAMRARAAHVTGRIAEATGLPPDEIGRLTQEIWALRERLAAAG